MGGAGQLLLFGSPSGEDAQRKGPGYTLRQENRARLKNALLEELWGEQPTGMEKYGRIGLRISDELREALERRQILDSDIQQVIDFAETSGASFAAAGPAIFWLTLSPPPSLTGSSTPRRKRGIIVHNAYSYRMENGGSKAVREKEAALAEQEWLCSKCGLPLEIGHVDVGYLGSVFPVESSTGARSAARYSCPRNSPRGRWPRWKSCSKISSKGKEAGSRKLLKDE